MITKDNYYQKIKDFDFSKLDATLQESKDFVDAVTEKGKSWEALEQDATIKEAVELYFKALNQLDGKEKKVKLPSKKTNKSTAKTHKKKKSNTNQFSSAKAQAIFTQFMFAIADKLEKNWFIHKGELLKVKKGIIKLATDQDIHSLQAFKKFVSKGWHWQNEMIRLQAEITLKTREDWLDFAQTYKELLEDAQKLIPKPIKTNARTPQAKKKTARQLAYEKADKVEKVSEELKFIKRFVLMHDKVKNQNQIRLFINALQKAIVEKRIRKTSSFAKEVNKIQDYLLDLFWKFKTPNEKIQINLDDSIRSKYLALVGKQTELYSVKLIKSYINLQGKLIPNQKAKNLYNRIANSINGNKLSKKDRYWEEIEKIMATLKSFVKKNTLQGELLVSTKELSGLNGIVLGCPCEDSLNGVLTSIPKNTIMSSTDIVKLNFKKLGFIGKWRKLIGDPSAGFRAMIFGKPKMGKSYLAVDFAGYLANNHGTVLYVAREEGIDDTLQQKLKDKKVAHPDLYVSDYLPEDLSAYDFVFLDSVNKLGLSPEDLDDLNKLYPHTSFVEVFQTTKQGNFRGGNEFQHDVDVVIEVPEKGKAVQFGRFNQGGEMDIFSQ
jgi:hypothetical protein